jgi:(2Fe-2S) ferredoxin
MSAPTREILVCMKAKHGDSCGNVGAAGVLAAIEHEIVLQGLDGSVRACASKCLDACGQGPAVAIRENGRETLERYARAGDAARLVRIEIEPETAPRRSWNGPQLVMTLASIRLQLRRVRGAMRRVIRTGDTGRFRRALTVLNQTRGELHALIADHVSA